MNGEATLSVQVHLPLDRFDLDVSFEASRRVTGVFGASGAGKTALLESIAGLRRGVRGTIRFGEEVWLDTPRRRNLPPERRGIGYVPQDSLLFPHLDVMGNLRAGRRRARREGHDFDRTLEAVVRVLDLRPLLGRAVAALSGGERQRVALGRALCSGPRLLLLDEPLASLDAGLRRKVLPFLHRVRAEFDLPILFVSHNPVEVQALCEDLIVLRDGRIVAHGAPRAVLTQPDVFPLAAHEGFANVLPGVLLGSEAETSSVRLGAAGDDEGPVLTVPRSGRAPGSVVLVSVPANEITLAVDRPSGVSARNVIPARVDHVQAAGEGRLVTLRLAGAVPPLVAEVTAGALADLHLEPGMAVYLLVKTSAITLYEAPPVVEK